MVYLNEQLLDRRPLGSFSPDALRTLYSIISPHVCAVRETASQVDWAWEVGFPEGGQRAEDAGAQS